MNNTTLDSMLEIWANFYISYDFGIGYPHKCVTQKSNGGSASFGNNDFIPWTVLQVDKALFKLSYCERISLKVMCLKCGTDEEKAKYLDMKLGTYRKNVSTARKKLKNILD